MNPLEEIFKKDVKDFTKDDAKKTMEIPCQGRGEHFLNVERGAFGLGGIEGVKKLKKEMINFGFPIDFSKIDPLGWYPLGWVVLTLIALKKVFNLKDEDFIEIGAQSPAFSFIMKFFFKHFLSRRTAFKNVPNYWRKNYSCGRLEPVKYHEKEGEENYFVIRLHDFKIHPIYCKFFLGYFLQVAKLLGGRDATIEEIKCMYKKAHYHEFIVRWK